MVGKPGPNIVDSIEGGKKEVLEEDWETPSDAISAFTLAILLLSFNLIEGFNG
jgi:hypothetical protein